MEALYKNYLLLYGSKKILEYGNFFSTLFSSTKSYHIPRGRVKGKLKMEISIFIVWKLNLTKMTVLPQLIYKFHAISHKTPTSYF
jgi:hypothetical protein